jgi:hypothetical protein
VLYDSVSGYAYVTNGYGTSDDWFTVVKVSPANAPAVVYTLSDATYLQDPGRMIKVGANHIVVRTAYGLVAVNISNPLLPVIAGTPLALPPGTPFLNGMTLQGSTLVLTDSSVYFVNVSDVTNMTLINTYGIPGFSLNFGQNCFARAVASWDANRVVIYAASPEDGGFCMLNVANPSSPVVEAFAVGVTPSGNANMRELFATPPYVFLLDQVSGLRVIQYLGA